VQHAEPLRGLNIAGRGGAAKPARGEPAVVEFNAFSRDFALELEPNARLARGAARLGADAGAYRGTVAGKPRSWARIVLTPGGLSGLVFDGETLYGIDSGDVSADAVDDAPAMFRLADVYFAPGELGCDVDGAAAAVDGEQAIAALEQEFAALAAAGAMLSLDLGAVADFEFSQAFGANAETALLTRLNNVDGIFSEQLGVQITVAEVDIFTSSDDPFTGTAANALLDQLARYRGATPSQEAQGLTHLFTGRNLDGSTVGIAFFGAVCATRSRFDARSFGAGLSQARAGNAVVDSLVAAHEVGHTFGAPHDGDVNGACASTPTVFLMAPRINGSSVFSACSIEEMQAEIAGAQCLTPIGPASVTVTFAAPAGESFAGIAFTRNATVLNEGADTATGVTFTATAEPGLAIVAAEAGGASCTASQSEAACELGSLGGGAARGVALTLRSASVGTFGLTATAGADDGGAGDGFAAVTVTVKPLVDLVLSSGSLPGAALNASTTIEAAVANASNFAATSVAVTAALSAGLRLEQAALDGTPCTIGGQTFSCAARPLAAGATAALVVTATSVAAGSQQMTVSVSASEAERTPADNELAIAVMVSAPAAESGGGGGASSWLTLLALLSALRLRGRLTARRRRPS